MPNDQDSRSGSLGLLKRQILFPIVQAEITEMSLFTAVAGIAKIVGKGISLIKGGGAVAGGALTGAALAGGVASFGGKKRRRRRKRLTDSEISELLMLKSIVGPRSPAMTIAVMKMLGRGG